MSKRKPMSQREAYALKRRVEELEHDEDRRRNAWADSYPGGVNITTIDGVPESAAIIRVARQLGHACVATLSSDGGVRIYALPLAKESRT
jgi:hypothetical protein